MKQNTSKQLLLISLIAVLALILSACGGTVPTNSVVTETTVPATVTTRPTETATATPEAGIDMEKFQNFPQSYEYLLAHLDEFVQAPDPITDRAAFDRWYTEEFVPALGPISERELNLETYSWGPGYYSVSLINRQETAMTGNPNFFYFENSGVIYPVPCINVTGRSHPGVTQWTFCPILFERRDLIGNRWGTSALEEIARGSPIWEVMILKNVEDWPDKSLDWGNEVPTFIGALGGLYPDSGTYAYFGIGYINFFNR